MYLLIPITLGGIAGYMAIHNIDGWGWFLFAAVISIPSIKKTFK